LSQGIERFIRADLAGFTGYAASKSPDVLEGRVDESDMGIIKLDANENPYGCSVGVNRALAEYGDINIYPDSRQTELRKLLSGYTGMSMRQIVAGAGSDQLIDLILRLFLEPGDEVINCVPTFVMFDFFTRLNGGTVVEIPRDKEYLVDVGAVKKAVTGKTKVIFMASPNNPTGTIMPQADILKVLDTGVPVVVDEAYYEFDGETAVPLIGQYSNLMVLRTFSKWAGLAGLRVGYGVFSPKIADHMLRIKEPYCVNAAALVAVKESLKDINYLMASVKTIIMERERLFGRLGEISWLKPYPSQANFILCLVLKGGARELQQRLEDRGILIRYFDNPLLRDCVRVSIGRPEENDILMETLNEIGEEIDG
jgi:histidinol-phosphate aminotransferase